MHKDGRLTDAKAKTARVENFHGWRPLAFITSANPPAAQRPFVGLTDEKITEICVGLWSGGWRESEMRKFARAIEAKLKEKNT
jgi:hypothetical protein